MNAIHVFEPCWRKRLQINSGRPKETNTFKTFCLLAGTEKSKEIRKYYITLEETIHEIIEEQNEELKLKLMEKKGQLAISN